MTGAFHGMLTYWTNQTMMRGHAQIGDTLEGSEQVAPSLIFLHLLHCDVVGDLACHRP